MALWRAPSKTDEYRHLSRAVFGPFTVGVWVRAWESTCLLKLGGKICGFDCIYCECGLNDERRPKLKMPSREAVREARLRRGLLR